MQPVPTTPQIPERPAPRPLTVLEAAQHYTARGWPVLPVGSAVQGDPETGKRPVDLAGGLLKDWERLRLEAADLPSHFAAKRNVGVLLGSPSGGLVDVDLDTREALRWAPVVLPPTWTFGREGAPRSHFLFIAEGAKTRQHRALDGVMLCELRSTGGQTVMPPSCHHSGEPRAWSDDRDVFKAPRTVDARQLARAVARLAVAAQLHRLAGEAAAAAWLRSGELPNLDAHSMSWVRRTLGAHDPRWVQPPPRPPPHRSGHSGHLDTVERARRYLERVPPAVSGQGGHVRTLLAAEHLVRGFQLDDDNALNLLSEWNARCLPPWSEGELRHKVAQARERGTAVAWGQHLAGRAA